MMAGPSRPLVEAADGHALTDACHVEHEIGTLEEHLREATHAFNSATPCQWRLAGHRRPGHPRADFGPTLLLIVSPIGPVQPASVRQASSADLETLVSLFDGYRQFYGQPCELDRVREFLSERLTQGDSVLFIAEADGRAVGFTQLYPSFSSVSMAPIFILNDLFVRPEARRSGVARRLLEAALRQGR